MKVYDLLLICFIALICSCDKPAMNCPVAEKKVFAEKQIIHDTVDRMVSETVRIVDTPDPIIKIKTKYRERVKIDTVYIVVRHIDTVNLYHAIGDSPGRGGTIPKGNIPGN